MKYKTTIMKQNHKTTKQTCDKTARPKEGLHDPAYEHDACGVGMIVNLNGNKSHELVDSALRVLENMKHRGAEGADNKTGDGAGIMVQIPHEFILLQGIPVPEKGKYGTGLIFLPKPGRPGTKRTRNGTGHQTSLHHRHHPTGKPGTHALHHPQED